MAAQFSNLGDELDLELQQGADFSRDFTITDTAGNAVDIGGANFTAQIRKNWRSQEILASFGATIATDPATGVVTLTLNSNDTGELRAGADESDPMSQYVWDLEMVLAGKTTFPFYGVVAVRGRVTRP